MNDLTIIEYQGQRVLTTQQLAKCYETKPIKIHQNFINNKNRYQNGVHYFKLEGQELQRILQLEIFESQNKSKIRNLIVWTEKGCFLHAKSLGTDKAWDVFESLVDHYFRTRELPQLFGRQLQECINQISAIKEEVEQLKQLSRPVQILLPAFDEKPSETVDGHPRQRNRVRIYCAIDRLPEKLQAQVNQMIDNKVTYVQISQFLKDRGHSISKSAVCNYAKKRIEHQRRLHYIREQTLALVPITHE